MDSELPSRSVTLAFPHSWQAEVLSARQLIAPARSFTYPRRIDEEAEAMARGALEVLIRPAACSAAGSADDSAGATPFLATLALGFADPSAPSGLWSCPDPDQLCAVAGGYAYILNTLHPEQFTFLAFRPVLQVLPLVDRNLLLFAGHHALLAWGPNGEAWQTARLSSEGLRITEIRGDDLHGFGWDLLTDREVPFGIDLRTGRRSGPQPEAAR